MVLGLVLAGSPIVLLDLRAAMRLSVAAALMLPGSVGRCRQGKLFLHGGKEGAHPT